MERLNHHNVPATIDMKCYIFVSCQKFMPRPGQVKNNKKLAEFLLCLPRPSNGDPEVV